jgi:2-isopropylmalate synthase
MPDAVREFKWWAERKNKYLEMIGPYADGYGRAMVARDRETVARLGRVKIFDTTGRDGMQTPETAAFVTEHTGNSVVDNKVAICMMLAQWGIPIIEVGNAVSNPGEIEAIRRVRRTVMELGLGTEIVSLGRMVRRDIDAAVEANAKTMHIYSSGSIPHAWVKFDKMPEELMDHIDECVRYARQRGFEKIIVSLEDAARADPEHLVRVGERIYEAAGRYGIEYNIPDTIGVCDPAYMYSLITYLRSKIPQLPLQVHCHNDMGMAVQNTIAAMLAGVDVAQVTVHGVGERTGNAAMEQVLMYMYLNYGIEYVDMKRLAEISKFVAERFGIGPAENAPEVGKKALKHTAGVHGDGVLKSEVTGYSTRNKGADRRDNGSVYMPYGPEIIGRKEEVGVGSLAGNKNVIRMLGEFGVSIPDEKASDILAAVKKRTATRMVSDADFFLMTYAVVMGKPCSPVDDVRIDVVSTGDAGRIARVRARVNGKEAVGEDTSGDGAVDVGVNAIRAAVGNGAGVKMSFFNCHGMGEGSNAPGRITMILKKGGLEVESSVVGTDTIRASIDAFVKGYNALHALEELRAEYPAVSE